jgi:uncharacterized membrane protein (UPF0127 family)
MKFDFFKQKKRFSVDVLRMGLITQFLGLMFSSSKTKIRLFSYNKDSKVMIHSWFVFYPFLIIWLDEKKKVFGWKKVLPFTSCVIPKTKFRHFIEVPFNSSNKKLLAHFLPKN